MKNKKSKVISFRLTEEQYKPYEALLEKSSKSPSEFFRELFLSKEKNISVIFNESKPIDYFHLLREINKAGNNLNQIARHFNSANKANIITDDLFKKGINLLININTMLKNLDDDS
ncbi:plasmid mobilization relaxosome protein MobC [Gilliamella sp. W8126]|uniref:plasmid mobilization protein n=1 Tax=Gilliamella sp. W8126 TaxID=2750946 RepID=UPI0018DDCD73|nr:plasmid mobilization relaxosome protein MobC [Gilliamella sp. W8126]MBI0006983.1 plasmid mobilization relaxosome protein MobC [Gilliamella sp. W8126]